MNEPRKFMGREEILDTIRNLARSQGLYSRLHEHLQDLEENDPEQYDWFMNHLANQQFSNPVDLVLFFEA